MTFKVVRINGAVVAFGPNADSYEPAASYSIEDAEPTISPTPLAQIAAIEAANPITHRNLRDLSMTVAQIAAAVTGTDPMVNPAVQQIAALEAQISALRAQL
jgi:hypothetical protein